MSALYARSLCDIADAIATGELSSVEVTRQQLARIDAKEPELGAFVMVLADEALEEAEQCDRLRIRRNQPGASLGPLHGVPIGIKDIYNIAGIRFQNIAANDAVISSKLTTMIQDGWELIFVTSGVESDAGSSNGQGIFITRYVFKKD